ncbi:MAG: zinc ribbon domain-containing protein [Blautia sp.]
MKCSYCKKEIPDQARFCGYCGKEIIAIDHVWIKCPRCGRHFELSYVQFKNLQTCSLCGYNYKKRKIVILLK